MSPPSPDDFDFKLLGEEKVETFSVIRSNGNPRTTGLLKKRFLKRITFSGKDDFVVRKSIYYDLDGELSKELIVHEIKELDPENHTFRYMNIEVVNKQNGRRSTFVNEKIEFKPDLDETYFTTRYLERE